MVVNSDAATRDSFNRTRKHPPPRSLHRRQKAGQQPADGRPPLVIKQRRPSITLDGLNTESACDRYRRNACAGCRHSSDRGWNSASKTNAPGVHIPRRTAATGRHRPGCHFCPSLRSLLDRVPPARAPASWPETPQRARQRLTGFFSSVLFSCCGYLFCFSIVFGRREMRCHPPSDPSAEMRSSKKWGGTAGELAQRSQKNF